MRDISGILKQVYERAVGDRGAGQRHLRHGSGGAPVRDRQEVPGDPQRLVQLPLDADLRRGSHPVASTIVLKARRSGAGPAGAVRAARRSPKSSRRSARAARRWCSRRTSRPRPASSCPTTTCARSPTRCTRSGGLFVLDCIASGAIWVDMEATGVDVLISAPQKGWSGSPCCAFVMLGERGARAHRRHHQHQLRLRPEEVAADHGGLRERRPRVPRDHADRRADARCAT